MGGSPTPQKGEPLLMCFGCVIWVCSAFFSLATLAQENLIDKKSPPEDMVGFVFPSLPFLALVQFLLSPFSPHISFLPLTIGTFLSCLALLGYPHVFKSEALGMLEFVAITVKTSSRKNLQWMLNGETDEGQDVGMALKCLSLDCYWPREEN